MKKRLLSALLTFCMVFSLLPISGMAQETESMNNTDISVNISPVMIEKESFSDNIIWDEDWDEPYTLVELDHTDLSYYVEVAENTESITLLYSVQISPDGNGNNNNFTVSWSGDSGVTYVGYNSRNCTVNEGNPGSSDSCLTVTITGSSSGTMYFTKTSTPEELESEEGVAVVSVGGTEYKSGNPVDVREISAPESPEINEDTIFFFIALPSNTAMSNEPADYRYLTYGGSVTSAAQDKIDTTEDSIRQYVATWPDMTDLGGTDGLTVSSTPVGDGSSISLDDEGKVTAFTIKIGDEEYINQEYGLRWAKISYVGNDGKDSGNHWHVDGMLYEKTTVEDILGENGFKKVVSSAGLPFGENGERTTEETFSFVLDSLESETFEEIPLTATVNSNDFLKTDDTDASRPVEIEVDSSVEDEVLNQELLPGNYVIREVFSGEDEKVWGDPREIEFTLGSDGEIYKLDTEDLSNKTITNDLKVYTLTYDSNGGTWPDTAVDTGEQTFYYNQNASVTSTQPARDGFTFQGWSTTKDGTVAYKAGNLIQIKGDTTLYAVWKSDFVPAPSATVEKDVTITRNGEVVSEPARPGDLLTYTITVTNNGNVELTDLTVTDIFTGAGKPDFAADSGVDWNPTTKTATWTVGPVAADGGTANLTYTYTVQDADEGKTISNTATVNASGLDNPPSDKEEVPVSDRVTLTYDANGGRGEDVVETYDAGDEAEVRSRYSVGFYRPGYSFVGWNTLPNGRGDWYEAGDEIEMVEDVTLYAIWDRDSTGGGGGGSDDDDEEEPEPEPAPELDTESHIAYVSGTPEGTVEPEAYITREEVAAIFFRLLTDRSRANYITDYNPFPDVEASRWSFYPIVTMNNGGIMHGYDDGNFAPGAYITRAEFAVVAAQFSDAEYSGADLFRDISGHWARDYINRAASEGWIAGYPDGSFGPDDYITRAQVMALVNEVLDRAPDADYMLDDMIIWPDNADESAWYYEDVQEATNSHSYVWRSTDRTSEDWEDLIEMRTLDELIRDAFAGVGIAY